MAALKWCRLSECDDDRVTGCEQNLCWKHHQILCKGRAYSDLQKIKAAEVQ